MNKTNIEWCDYTWSPVTGCLHGCSYCYARKLAKTRLRGRCGYPQDNPFTPTFHPNRFDEPLSVKKPSRIFVCSMGDLFGEWMFSQYEYCSACQGTGEDMGGGQCPKCKGNGYDANPMVMYQVIDIVISMAKQCPQHTFIFLTKNPKRYAEFDFPENCWLGTSVTGDYSSGHTREIEDKKIYELSKTKSNLTFISWEPVMGPHRMNYYKCDWLIMGAMTGPRSKKYAPDPQWIEDAIKTCRERGIPIFMKKSLADVCKALEIDSIQEWPK